MYQCVICRNYAPYGIRSLGMFQPICKSCARKIAELWERQYR